MLSMFKSGFFPQSATFSPGRKAVMMLPLLSKICVFGAGHCFYTQSAGASAAYCYAAVLGYTLSVSIQRSRLGEHGHATHLIPVKRMRWFPTFLSFSYFTRVVWLVLSNMHMFEWVEGSAPNYKYAHMVLDAPLLPTDIDMFVLGVSSFGKLATLLYFSAFTLLLRFWEDVLYQARRAEQPLARIAANQSVIQEYTREDQHEVRSRKLFLVANVWIYLVELALLVAKTLFPNLNSVVFELDYAVVALAFLLLAVMLARCAWQLRKVLRKIEFSMLAMGIARRVALIGALVSLLFLYRSVLLVLTVPAIDVFDPQDANPWLLYALPELLPGCLVISMMNVKRQQHGKKQKVDERTPLLRANSMDDAPRFRGLELSI